MNELPENKILKYLWLGICLFFLGVFITLAFYNCPQSDDFYYAMWMRDWGFAGSNITIYYAWGGRYFSNILLTLCNGLAYSKDYQEFLIPYQLHSVFHILFSVWACLILFQRNPFISRLWPALIPLMFFVEKAASIPEFFYWFAGSATYCSGFIFGALALSAVLDLQNQPENHFKWKPDWKIFACLGAFIILLLLTPLLGLHKYLISALNNHPGFSLGALFTIISYVFFHMWQQGNSEKKPQPTTTYAALFLGTFACAGANELCGAMLFVAFGFVWFWNFNWKNALTLKPYLPLVLSIFALALNVLAPATTNREGTLDMSLVHNWNLAWNQAISIFSNILFMAPLCLIGFFLGYQFHDRKLTRVKFLKLLFLFFAFNLTMNLLLPLATLYKAGMLPERAVNLHILTMTISCFTIFWMVGNFLREKSGHSKGKWIFYFNLILPVFFLFNFGKNNLIDGLDDLRLGRASSFLKEFKAEQEAINNCIEPICEVPATHAKPICISSMSNSVVEGIDPASWIAYKNNSYAAFYGKKSIFQKGIKSIQQH